MRTVGEDRARIAGPGGSATARADGNSASEEVATGTAAAHEDAGATPVPDPALAVAPDAPLPPPPLEPDAGRAAGAFRASLRPTFVYNVLSQVVTFGFGVVLARLLSPQDFGLLGMTLVFANVAAVLGNFGIAAAAVQARTLSPVQERAVFSLSLAVSLLAGALVVAFARPIAAFFGQPVVADLMWLMALNFVANGLGTVPWVRMNRALRLRELARIDPLAAIAGGVASVALAWAGGGVWSLAAGIVVASLSRLLLYSLHVRWSPLPGFDFRAVRDLTRYATGLMGSSFFVTLTTNVDLLLVGRLLNPFALGIYMRALRLVTIPQTQFSLVVVRLLFPYFARIQDDADRTRRDFLRVVCTAGLLALPTLALLAVVAHDFVEVVYGSKWLPAVLPLRILCLAGMVKAISAFAGPVLDARGYARWHAVLQGAYAGVLLTGILWAARWGVTGVAAALGVASLGLGAALLVLVGRLLDLEPRALGRALAPGALAMTAVGIGSGLAYLVGAAWPPSVRLVIAVAVGLASAAAALEGLPFVSANPVYRDVRDYVARWRARRREPEPQAAAAGAGEA